MREESLTPMFLVKAIRLIVVPFREIRKMKMNSLGVKPAK